MQVADLVARILKEEGISYVFGYPGGEVTTMLEALRKQDVRFILTKHESSAAFMAAAVGEMTGIPGVCLSTLGPGATNLVTGVAHAYLDRAPMLAITGNMSTSVAEVSTHQKLDLVRLYQPISKWSTMLEPQSAERMLHKALNIAKATRPGPVHLNLPSDVALAETAGTLSWAQPLRRQATFRGDLRSIAQRLTAAQKPLILAGLGVLRGNAAGEFREFVEHVKAPVMVTPKAKGIISENHPLFLGVVEMLGDTIPLDYAKASDLIITVGYDVVELIKPWMFNGIPTISIAEISDGEVYYPIQEEISGDIKSVLASLNLVVEREAGAEEEVKKVRRALLEAIMRKNTEKLSPAEVIMTARKILPADTIAVTDVGAQKMLMGQLWETYEPNTYFVSNGLSSMGYGVPAAMAAKLIHPTRPVVAIVGDGGFAMSIAEFETMVREKIPVIIIVMDDRTLSLIRMNQERKGYPSFGVEFANPDLVRLAESFGFLGFKVVDIEALQAALTTAQSSNKPAVIQAVIDPAGYRL